MVLETKEMFRITYDDGSYERFMVQTYTDSEPFYYLAKGEGKNGYQERVPVETSSSNLNEIIEFMEIRVADEEKAFKRAKTKYGKKIADVHEYCLAKTKELFSKMVELNSQLA